MARIDVIDESQATGELQSAFESIIRYRIAEGLGVDVTEEEATGFRY